MRYTTFGFHCFILLRYCFWVALLDIFSTLTLLAFGKAATSVLDNLGSGKCSMLPLIKIGMVPGLGGIIELSAAAAAWLAAADASSHSLVRPRKRWVMLLKVDAESKISALFRATWKTFKNSFKAIHKEQQNCWLYQLSIPIDKVTVCHFNSKLCPILILVTSWWQKECCLNL